MLARKSVLKWGLVPCLLLFVCLTAPSVQAGSVYDYQYTIIPREVHSIVATMCNSFTRDAATKGYAILNNEGFDALVAKTRASIGKEQDQSTRIKMIAAQKETLMFAIIVQRAIDSGKGGNAGAGLKQEMAGIIADTLKGMCTNVSNLDKILYDANGNVKQGPYAGMLQELNKVAADVAKRAL